MKARALAVAVVAVLSGPAGGAWALGISVPAASVGALAPGQTATSASTLITITGLATEAWAVRVDDPAGGATAGHMLRSAACTLGVSSLAHPLHMALSGGLPTTTIDRASYDVGTASNPVIAHGSTPDAFSVVFSQAVNANEVLKTGCVYSVTLRYTVAAN
jgi:hypothetical protein